MRVIGIIAAVAFAVLSATGAHAFTHGTVQFNGNKMQINPNFIEGGCAGEYPFINFAKTASTTLYGDNSGVPNPSNNDINGYPTNAADLISHNGVVQSFCIPTVVERPGNYVYLWGGNGTVSLNQCLTLVSGSLTSTTGAGRAVAAVQNSASCSGASGAISVTIGIHSICTSGCTGSPTPYIYNVALVHANDEALYNTYVALGMPWGGFGTQFVSLLRQSTAVIRYMDWDNANASNRTVWANRQPVNYITYGGDQFQSALNAGSTTNVGDDYTIACPTTCPGGAANLPADKQTMHLFFNANATATPNTVTICGNTVTTITACGSGGPFTATSAIVVNWPSHGLSVNAPVGFANSGLTLPKPMFGAGVYFVQNVIDTNDFTISTTSGGTALLATTTTTSTQSAIRESTLNLNGAGAIRLRDNSGNPLVEGDSVCTFFNCGSSVIAWNTLVYDASFNVWTVWGVRQRAGLTAGVPPEVELALAAQVGAHPYFAANALTIDPMSDWVPSLAAYLKANKPAWMVPRQETTDETWNNLLVQTQWAFNRTMYHWQSYGTGFSDVDDWVGLIGSTIGQAFNNVFGGEPDGTKYQSLIGAWTSDFAGSPPFPDNPRLASTLYLNTPSSIIASVSGTTLNVTSLATVNGTFIPILTLSRISGASITGSPTIVSQLSGSSGNTGTYKLSVSQGTVGSEAMTSTPAGGVGLPQSGYSQTAASNWTNRLVIANYWFNSSYATATEILQATQYMTAAGNPATQTSIATSTFAANSLASLAFSYSNAQIWSAQSQFVNNAGQTLTLSGYEGGFSPDYDTGNNATIVSLNAPITGATTATQGVFTLGQDSKGNFYGAVTGQLFSVSGVSASGWTGLNGNTYMVQSVSGTGPYSVTLNVNTSGFGSNCSTGCGTATYATPVPTISNITVTGTQAVVTLSSTTGLYPGYMVNIVCTCGFSPNFNGWFTIQSVNSGASQITIPTTAAGTYTSGGTTTYVPMWAIVNVLRYAGKLAPNQQSLYLLNLANFKSFGGDFPSEFQFGGLGQSSGVPQNIPSTNVWSICEDIYKQCGFGAQDSPQFDAMRYFNTHFVDEDMTRAMMLGAANDNLSYGMVVDW
jgi:hypothetical protein